jgi:hypothetical protein
VGPLFVFVARFEDRASLHRAFGLVNDEHAVESSLIEPEELRIRFLATKPLGAALLARIYESGGLVRSRRFETKA